MSYREHDASLDERHRNLRSALEENRVQANALTEEEAALHRELAAVHTKLEAARRSKRQLPLANVLLASPCDVPWSTMVGDDRVRHCGACKKDVHNLSAMTRDELDAFLIAAQGTSGPMPCISLFQRADGTVLTADCPVGVRRRRARSIFAVTFGAGATALVAFTALALLLQDRPAKVEGCSLRPVPVTPTYTPVAMNELAPVAPGYVSVTAPAGTRIFEGERLIGTAPLGFAAFTAIAGTHAYRAEGEGRSEGFTVVVREREVANVSVLASARNLPRPGGMRRMPMPGTGR